MEENGKVTTRQFYEALLEQNKNMTAMERRILERIGELSEAVAYAADNKNEIAKIKEDIKSLERRYTWWSGINSAISTLAVAVLTYLGINK